ncbi:MAG: endonuclease/exonuclease/phosphatase family protein [Saprospiraceae bacterium]|jgi:endonuclease/exonuclease/phosphatase family metal-dependent hydrolase|nr:endonuclease/exonuclease/phosphatase family protein [Saprospiraceae bacterium]MBL0024008.1 endonuclease/exonuclease/phosphatase family protein [Saprospiraceae bacterium]
MFKIKWIFSLLLIISFTSANAQSIKAMTYNIRLDVASDGENRWTQRKDYFTAQIQFYEPDIMGIQEALPHQVTEIAKALTDYNFIGTGRDGIGKGESSNIFYKPERFNLKDSGTFWLSETPDIISKGWDAAYNRVCTYGLFKDKKSKKTFWVFNTHLDHMGEVARSKSIELILSKISMLNTKKYMVIFMGDLNSEPNTDRIIALKKVMDDSRDISSEKPFGPSGTFNGFKHNEPVTRLIDYIFVSKSTKIKVKKYAVLSDSKDLRYPSDHLPVYVEILL